MEELINKAIPVTGDFVAFKMDDELKVGRIEFIMDQPGWLGLEDSEYAVETKEGQIAVLVRCYEEEDGIWEEEPELYTLKLSDLTRIDSLMVERDVVTEETGGMLTPLPDEEMNKQAPCWDGYVQRGMKPGANGKPVPNCVPAAKADDLWEDDDTVVYETDNLSKAEGYSPPTGVRSAARRAIKYKEDGKAKGAGTSVGWTRAGQLARGESISLSTVKRMYSYFSRHEVDKKGKDFNNATDPSNGKIMWLAWGGDAGFAWSRGIVNREKDKALFAEFGKDYTKTKRINLQ